MSWNLWIRQAHRWLSIAFTVLVMANFGAIAVKLDEQSSMALGGITLIPLFLLLFSGLYLFAIPYLPRRNA